MTTASAIFKAVPTVTMPKVLQQLERRDRAVFMLANGKRTPRDIAHLVRRNELDVAKVLVRLTKQGYVEYLGASYLL
ncbi:MAG: hypothetical protein M3Z24_09625 [Chloroflexota bacterium]|nr:hypothetical protein [Chloroflexota bacterium]